MIDVIRGLAVLGLIGAAIYGWFVNLFMIFAMTSETPIGWIIGRVIGVIIPIIGAVLGFM